MSIPANYLTESSLPAGLQNCIALLISNQATANGINAQPTLPIERFPKLSEIQGRARLCAENYLSLANELKSALIAAATGFSNEFSSKPKEEMFCRLADQYTGLAKGPDEKTQIAKELLIPINKLKENIASHQADMGKLISDIKLLATGARTVADEFSGLTQAACKSLQEEEMASIQASINTVLSSIQKDNDIIVKGAVQKFVPILNTIVAAFSTLTSRRGGNLSSNTNRNMEVLTSNVNKYKEMNKKQEAAFQDVQTQIDAYRELMSQLEEDRLIYALLCTLDIQMELFWEQLNALAAALTDLDNSWKALSDNLASLIGQLESGSDEKNLAAWYSQAVQEWAEIHEQATNLQEMGEIKVENLVG